MATRPSGAVPASGEQPRERVSGAEEPHGRGHLQQRRREERCARGEPFELGPRAAAKFPGSAPVHAFYGLAAGCAGDVATARSELERSLELNPDQAKLRQTLAELSGS